MGRTLNVSILQMPRTPERTLADNLSYIRTAVDRLMKSCVRPELVVGVEMGITTTPQHIPGPATEFLGAIAKKHGIYLVPGTMPKISSDLPEGQYYNACPVFGPDGSLLTVCRKKVPVRPIEKSAPDKSGDYCTFRIPEKDLTVGVLVCYDQFFPEIPRTLTLMGSELILCPAGDPIEFRYIPDIIPRCRALENEVYYIWTNSIGRGAGTQCGRSVIVDPEGMIVDQCGNAEATLSAVLDLDFVRRKRQGGKDQHLSSMQHFQVEYPFAGRLNEAPVFQGILPLTQNADEWAARQKELGAGTFDYETPDPEDSDRLLDQLFAEATE